MPIVFIHGVAVRDDTAAELPRRFGRVPWPEVEGHLRTHVAPAISDDPAGVPILRMYWGDLGATLAWKGRFGIADGVHGSDELVDLRTLDADELGHLVEREVLRRTLSTTDWPDLIESVWTVARTPATLGALRECSKPEDAQKYLSGAIQDDYERRTAHARNAEGKDRASWWESLGRQVNNTADRALAKPRTNLINMLDRLRRPLELYVPIFMGDLINYLSLRGDATRPGPIPARALATLVQAQQLQGDRDGEPLVVLTHSMGGQIMYDLVTHFLPRTPDYADLKIDFWCACGTQVGLFEELKLFLESKSEYGVDGIELVPRPDIRHLGYWWNVWDHADLMSYSAAGIIDGVDDGGFFLGRSLQHDHSAYLDSSDFYRTLAAKIRVHTGRSKQNRDPADQNAGTVN